MARQEEQKILIKNARSKFLAMATAYSLGVFNDNFFKQAAMLLAVAAGKSRLQGIATVLFSLPFVLFSSYAGWYSDKFVKRNVIIWTKILEFAAMIAGAYGILFSNWFCIVAMVGLMGFQSTLFSPALNGSIPELYPEWYVPKANALLKLVTTLFILLGIALAGIALDQNWFNAEPFNFGRFLVSIIILSVSLIGVAASFKVNKYESKSTSEPFPWFGPINSIKDLFIIKKDKELFLALMGSCFFYGVSSFIVLTLNAYGLAQLNYSQTLTGLMSVALMIGICAGSILAAKLYSANKWHRLISLSIAGIAAGLGAVSAIASMSQSIQKTVLFSSLVLTGCFGGLLLIPIASFIQIRPAENEKGKILGVCNFIDFTGILIGGQIFSMVSNINPSIVLFYLCLFCFAAAIIFYFNIRDLKMKNSKNLCNSIIIFFLKCVLFIRYSIKISGLDKIKKTSGKGILFLPNHPALIDPVILYSVLYNKFQPRPLAAQEQLDSHLVNFFAKRVNPISVPDIHLTGKENKDSALKSVMITAEALKSGDNVILYPSGRLYTQYLENIGANSSVEFILKEIPGVQIVLIKTSGLWGGSLSRADGTYPSFTKKMKIYIISLFLNLIFFGPRRKVTIDIVEPADFPRNSDRLIINKYLENFYNNGALKNTFVPYNWFQGFAPKILPEPEQRKISGNVENVSKEIRDKVIEYLKKKTGIKGVSLESNLSADLGIDSISLADIMVWIESEFNVALEDMEGIHTAGDCVIAAAGIIVSGKSEELSNVNIEWFKPNTMDKTIIFQKENLGEIFLEISRKFPNQLIIADKNSGSKTYADLTAAIIIFQKYFSGFAGDRIGIMLPASVASVVSYFGALFSGKVPVMINWTVGEKQMKYSLEQTNVSFVVTSKQLLNKIKSQGFDYSQMKINWIFLEEFAAAVSKLDKLSAFLKSRFPSKFLNVGKIKDTAVILFTSGSEDNPKSVPLSHKNIIQNIRDVLEYVKLENSDVILGMLPPFHSFGITATMMMPLCLGLKTAYHPNPTEGVMLAKIISAYKVSMLVGTPTFLNGIMRCAIKKQMQSVKIIAAGAEKCSEHVFNAIKEICPQAVVCEGYGITECSPIVSFNPTDKPAAGTIGKVLKSIEYAIINPETRERVGKGAPGMLLVRGDSIFSGYLNEKDNNPFMEFDNKTWYKTGDLVSENENGYLVFQGRLKRFIKIGGEMISLPAIESVLNKNLIPDNFDNEGPAFAVEELLLENSSKLVLFTILDADKSTVNTAIRKSGLSNLHAIYRIIKLDELPVLGTGKTDYKKLKSLLTEFLKKENI